MTNQREIDSDTQSEIPETLKVPEKFTYEFFESNRYVISQLQPYESLCNNGFIKLYTQKGRVYWLVQNEFGHITPDWKFHISVAHHDLRQAWNLVLGIFLKMKCTSGLKVIYLPEISQPQKGREITVYILKYADCYSRSQFAGDFGLSIAQEHSEDYWIKMVLFIEKTLKAYQIEWNGLADGDLPIGRYVSLRNESFVLNDKNETIYPPNEEGWNPNRQELPFNVGKLKLAIEAEEPIDKQQPTFYAKALKFISIPLFFGSIYFIAKKSGIQY